MRYLTKIIQLFITLIFTQILYAKDLQSIDEKIGKIIQDGKIYRKAVVNSDKGIQSLDYQIHGIHPNKCSSALKKLSRYEKFHEYLDIVKLSGYSDKKGEIYLFLDSSLMPFPMSLHFKIERITKPGKYQFSFDKGFLKGLLGTIEVTQTPKGCYFYANSHWKGKASKIPDSVFEIFSETIGELAMKNLFRVSTQL
ncbi:hypothetical protein [Bacteriovorax sp. Seq25_V]|uniref:hypothetical protein n=1 Tax=Bacteriovorax sp. Seq25_V TaxID=1201288 RepID=UPI00038A185C|nr:hypothetical protein [Bacteriovorax sp. Seq25_V]EQC46211.1 hypothetical protein M900_1673 [Bacteriovorax sp. Seq25_V]